MMRHTTKLYPESKSAYKCEQRHIFKLMRLVLEDNFASYELGSRVKAIWV